MTAAVVKITPSGVEALQSIHMYLSHDKAMQMKHSADNGARKWVGKDQVQRGVLLNKGSPGISKPELGNGTLAPVCGQGGDGETCTRGRRNLLPRPPPPQGAWGELK